MIATIHITHVQGVTKVFRHLKWAVSDELVHLRFFKKNAVCYSNLPEWGQLDGFGEYFFNFEKIMQFIEEIKHWYQ